MGGCLENKNHTGKWIHIGSPNTRRTAGERGLSAAAGANRNGKAFGSTRAELHASFPVLQRAPVLLCLLLFEAPLVLLLVLFGAGRIVCWHPASHQPCPFHWQSNITKRGRRRSRRRQTPPEPATQVAQIAPRKTGCPFSNPAKRLLLVGEMETPPLSQLKA